MRSENRDAGLIGSSVSRREDERFLAGTGSFVADELGDAYHVAFVRSREAAADLLQVDISAALGVPDVVAAYTAADLPFVRNQLDFLTVPQKDFVEATSFTMSDHLLPILADRRVLYVGQPIVAVVARDRYSAEDGAEQVRIRYSPREPVVDVEAAAKPGSPLVPEGAEDNEAARITVQFGEADIPEDALTVTGVYRIGRHGGMPIETRGVHVRPDPQRRRIDMRTSTQVPYMVRRAVCTALGISPDELHVSAPDVGGGFGTKANVYAEDVVLVAIARELGHAVAWIEDRHEHLTSAAQGRDQVHHARLTVDPEGRILHLEDDFLLNVGSGSLWTAGIIANTAIHLLGGYRIPKVSIHGRAFFTNTALVAQYRGAGRPEAAFTLERILDAAAHQLGLTPEEIRRRNLLTAEDMPYHRPVPYRDGVPICYDGGDYRACLEAVLEDLPRAATAAYAEQHPELLIGYGLGSYVEATGRGPWESARIRLNSSTGTFVAITGATSAGMSHETTFTQVAAQALGIPFESVRYERTDSDQLAFGVGSFASRSAVLAGSALYQACLELLERARVLVGELTAAQSINYEDGTFTAGDQKLTWRDVAAALTPGGRAEQAADRLDVTHIYRPETVTWTMGVHAAVVGVHPSSGVVRVLDYAVVHEGGVEINPTVVHGQVIGGLAQGIGGALLEKFAYGDDGAPLSTTFLTYKVPESGDIPPVRVRHLPVETSANPIGVRGAGESGTIAAYPALASAVDDALGAGAHVTATPISPAGLRRILRERSSV